MSEIEKQFFETFGVEPKIEQCYHFCNKGLNCKECDEATKIYPQITDSILLELVTLHSCWCVPRLCCFNVEQLKQQVLSDLSIFNDKRIELIHQVQALFKENK